jgi:hypothetical protein
MKFHETSFEDYLISSNKISLHPKLEKQYKTFPKTIDKFNNIIFYGPSGTGKYTQMLSLISRYSPSQLKYEKKLITTYNKNTFFFKISDIHYEVDLSILGCHSKFLWNDIYNQIYDIVIVTKTKIGIIVCKNFHEIHDELLEIFYSFMQKEPNQAISLKFILITESVSFIPDNIINCCKLIQVPRPSRIQYNKCFINCNKNMCNIINNMKHAHSNINKPIQPYDVICTNIYTSITNKEEFSFSLLREQLYDILIYNLNIDECMWIIFEKITNEKQLNDDDLVKVLSKLYKFFVNYNNNYRPIFHLEKIAINLMQIIHSM